MEIRPIPWVLLADTLTLKVPDGSGYSSVGLSNVRVLWRSKVSEYSSTIVRDNSELTVYYDCTRSSPADVKFHAGMRLEYDGEDYEILDVRQFCTDRPHHIKIMARHI